MREVFILTAHLLVTLAKLARPGGLRAVAAESLAVKHQLLIVNNHPKVIPINHLKLPPPGFRVSDWGSAKGSSPSPLRAKATVFMMAPVGRRVWV